MQFFKKCGCQIYSDGEELDIFYCNLHRHAPETFNWLIQLLNVIDEWGDRGWYNESSNGLLDQIEKHITRIGQIDNENKE